MIKYKVLNLNYLFTQLFDENIYALLVIFSVQLFLTSHLFFTGIQNRSKK